MLQDYLIDCIKARKKPHWKILSQYKEVPDYASAYCLAYEIEHPHCALSSCNNLVDFLNIKKGFRKYCSKKCAMLAQGKRNEINNKKLNEINIDRYNLQYILNEEKLLKTDLIDRYKVEETYTLKSVSKDSGLPYNFIRSYFKKNNLVDKFKSKKKRRLLLDEQFETINEYLLNEEWVLEKLQENWTAKAFADYLNCSPNYICTFLRNIGKALPNNTAVSFQEIKIRSLLESLNIEFEVNKRNIISPYELDIYLPAYKLAIEINGSYWHSNINKSKEYHLLKTEECETRGITLLHFFDFEIDNKFFLVESIIRSKLNLITRRYARSCNIKELSSNEYKLFLEENHIQGSISSRFKLGLFYEDQLLSVMGFSKSRYNKKYTYELDRFCNKRDYAVIGGASKLFKQFIRENPNCTIITYAQKRLFTGKLYSKLGFDYSHTSPIGYFWSNGNDSLSRLNSQKHKLPSNSMTEDEFMTSKGYYKIYDCGNRVYTYINK